MTPLLDCINSVLAALNAIPYTWSDPQNRPANLFQLVAMWNDQVKREQSGEGYTFAKPACFIEIMPIEWQQLNLGVNTCDLKIKFHLVAEQLDAGDGTMDQNLQFITYRDLLMQKINGFVPAYCGALSSTNEYFDYEHNNVYHLCVEMNAAFVDVKGSPTEDWVAKEPDTGVDITAEYVINLDNQ